MSEVRNILENLGYRLKDIGAGRYQTSAIYRNGDNPQALLINPNGSFVDFVDGSNSGSFKKLIALTLGKSYKEVDRYLKNKKYEEVSNEREEVDLSNTYPSVYPSRDFFGKLEEDNSYWVNRGIPEKLVKHLRGGVVKQRESRLFNRFVIPMYARDGQTILGFAARALWPVEKGKGAKWKLLGAKKYWEWPLFLTEKYIREQNEIVICESAGDFLALSAAGIKFCVAPIGIASFEKLTSLCIEFDPKRIIIAFNNDQKSQAGNKAALNLQKCLLNFFNKDKIKVAWPTKYNDMGDAALNGDLDYIKEWYSEIK